MSQSYIMYLVAHYINIMNVKHCNEIKNRFIIFFGTVHLFI